VSSFPVHRTGAIPKPAKGTARRESRARSAERKAREDREKRKVRARDRVCRRPHCRHCGNRLGRYALHCSHVVAKGIGGDPRGLVSTAADMLRLCAPSHAEQERHDLDVVPRNAEAGTYGECEFYRVEGGQRFFEGIS
jgi:hypothetical protein